MAISSIPFNRTKVKRKYIIYKVTNLETEEARAKVKASQETRQIQGRDVAHGPDGRFISRKAGNRKDMKNANETEAPMWWAGSEKRVVLQFDKG